MSKSEYYGLDGVPIKKRKWYQFWNKRLYKIVLPPVTSNDSLQIEVRLSPEGKWQNLEDGSFLRESTFRARSTGYYRITFPLKRKRAILKSILAFFRRFK